ncbi:MAG: hypothetical protein KA054_04030 [Candidatus Moranbacteria bacterium]|jgi:hypothetical protein|nr:hypothetical protein [Candidatus Moranbacteria bacterium]MBP7822556.1 hypothetical protein [Candidatus Moranbacteria bacterium]
MGIKITLPVDVRYFTKATDSRQLCRTDKVIPAGSVIRLQGSIQSVVYDHRDQEAIAFRFNKKVYYFLIHEIRIADLKKQIRTPRYLRVVK